MAHVGKDFLEISISLTGRQAENYDKFLNTEIPTGLMKTKLQYFTAVICMNTSKSVNGKRKLYFHGE